MLEYTTLKVVHQTCVILTLISFLTRGYWMMRGSTLLQHKIVKIAPHIIDTTLLVSAILLTIAIQQFPFQQSWLTAKVVALIAYVVLGTFALKRRKTQRSRCRCFVLALLCFIYIVVVAITKKPTLI